MDRVLKITVVLAWVLYSAIGIIGYLYALDNTCDSIFSNLPRDWLTGLGRIGLVATLAFSYPLFIVPCRATVCDLVTRYYYHKGMQDDEKVTLVDWLQSLKVRVVLTSIIVACSAFLACIIPSAALFVSLTGSTVGTILALILPSLYYVRLPKDHRTCGITALASIIFVLGLIILCVCTLSAVSHATDDPCDAQK
jgi:amino acid permease